MKLTSSCPSSLHEKARAISARSILVLVTLAVIVGLMPRPAQFAPSTIQYFMAVLVLAVFTIAVLLFNSLDLAKKCAHLTNKREASLAEARVDCLTGLSNRKALVETLSDLLIDCQIPEISSYAVILDLDRFKSINDGFGHQVGDRLLASLGGRLAAMEETPGFRAFRLGGDEFALVIVGRTLKAARTVCQAVRDTIVTPYTTDDFHAVVGCSIGIAAIEPGLSTTDVLRRADLAMYRAKKSSDAIAVFDAPMLETVQRNADLCSRLRLALRQKVGLSAKLQMILSRDKEMVALEALFRWSDEKHGSIPANEAIEIARANYLLDDITMFMVRSSIDALTSFPRARLCLNVEATQLLDDRFASALMRLVRSYNIESPRIQLEIRETDFVEFGLQMSAVLEELRDFGFLIAVDDFGSSNASLTYLRKLGVTELKFDQSVLKNARETLNSAVMKAKVELAKSLGLNVTCKGIVDQEDEIIALATGCDYLQGFRYCRPNSTQVFTEFFAKPALKLIA